MFKRNLKHLKIAGRLNLLKCYILINMSKLRLFMLPIKNPPANFSQILLCQKL